MGYQKDHQYIGAFPKYSLRLFSTKILNLSLVGGREYTSLNQSRKSLWTEKCGFLEVRALTVMDLALMSQPGFPVVK